MAKTVLIVEDNELNMKLFRDLLEAHGYQTSGTSNGFEALDLVRKLRPDLILMDIKMPGLDGIAAARRIADLSRRTRVILMSADLTVTNPGAQLVTGPAETEMGRNALIGASYDWSREISTHEPEYYRWNQWFFLQMFQRGLAYRKDSAVNWCPNDQTVLANEQVVGGRCERCDAIVTKKKLTQWYFKITEYADRLLADMDQLEGHWPDRVLSMQRNWIGRSTGALARFESLLVQFLQTITVDDQWFPRYHGTPDWIEKYIFPGGELASVGEMLKSLARTTSLSMYHAENCGTHYAHTLRAWRARFRNNLARVRALGFDDRLPSPARGLFELGPGVVLGHEHGDVFLTARCDASQVRHR